MAKSKANGTPASKACSKCGKRRKLDAYYRSAGAKDGRCSACKECENKQVKAWRERKEAEAGAR